MGLASLLLLWTKESRPSQLLECRVSAIRKATGNMSIRSQNPDHTPDFRTFAQVALVRPVRLLFTEPIIAIISLICAIAYGLIYLFTEALQIVYSSYGFNPQQTSLAFIPLAIGFCCGIFVRLYDARHLKNLRRLGHALTPEDKLTGFTIAALAFAIGLWWFSWIIPPKIPNVHWIISMIALTPIGFAINEMDCVLAGYMADNYTIYAASAFASLSLVRTTLSAAFPLFARQMYTNLGANYASSILAAIATLACINPLIFLRYGRRIREASKFARYSLETYTANRVDGEELENDRELTTIVEAF